MVSVAGTAVGSIPHLIDLKVTELPGGQLSEVTGFIVGPEDVVQVKQGENLIVSTSPDLMTNKVTVINIQGIPVDLVPLPSNAWSLQGLLPGVYTLNVNAAMSSSAILGTFETLLVILQPDQQPLPPTTIINQITIRQPGSPTSCPDNSTLINGKCTKPTPDPEVCPAGTTGTPPNCVPICPAGEDCPCPEGQVGSPPNCEILEECPEGTTGTPPDCVPDECPEGQEGTPPNCEPIVPENGDGGDNGGNGGDGGDGGNGGDGSDGGNGEGGGTIDIPSLFG